MKSLYLILSLVIQYEIIYAEISSEESSIEQTTALHNNLENENFVKDDKTDWVDLFSSSDLNLYPTSSATLMAQATTSDKSPEAQLEEIKEIANQITNLLQSDMTNLLTNAMNGIKNKDSNTMDDNNLRKKRSTETPMDSTKLIMRLLNHIKSNNEYQNIAIEKMMSAQEIADKYGITFNPDPDMLSDLAKTANEQALEMTSILKDACELSNNTQCDIVKPIPQRDFHNATQNSNEKDGRPISYDTPEYDFVPYGYDETDSTYLHPYNIPSSPYNYYSTHENQIPPPPVQTPTIHVSQKPNFYDTLPFYPQDYSYCSMDPSASVSIPQIDEFIIDPLLVAEEFEETVSSKVLIEHDPVELGAGTINHVTTYTLSEKAHFRNPQIENLPEQMQYYFLLV